jgi:hypothetical protein
MPKNLLKSELKQFVENCDEYQLNQLKNFVDNFLQKKNNVVSDSPKKYIDFYKSSLNKNDLAEIEQQINEGINDVVSGKMYTAKSVMKEMRNKYGKH